MGIPDWTSVLKVGSDVGGVQLFAGFSVHYRIKSSVKHTNQLSCFIADLINVQWPGQAGRNVDAKVLELSNSLQLGGHSRPMPEELHRTASLRRPYTCISCQYIPLCSNRKSWSERIGLYRTHLQTWQHVAMHCLQQVVSFPAQSARITYGIRVTRRRLVLASFPAKRLAD